MLRITRYLLLAQWRAMLVAAVVLLLVIGGNLVVRFLSGAYEEGVADTAVLTLIGLKLLRDMTVLLPLATLIGSTFAYAALWKRQEMTALFSIGYPLRGILRATLLAALLPALLTAALSLYIVPWSKQHSEQIAAMQQMATTIRAVQPKRFYTFAGGIVYADARDADGTLQRVFVHLRRATTGAYVIIADTAAEYIDADGKLQLRLTNGTLYSYNSDGLAHALSFGEYIVALVQSQPVTPSPSDATRAIATVALWSTDAPALVAERQWRLAIPIATVLLALFGMVIAHTPPRTSAAVPLLVALVVYVLYNNALVVGQRWLVDGVIPLWMGLWWQHLVLIAFTTLCWWRLYGRSR